ncbi:MAG: hypothetical protein LC637_07000, partial [Xanthomonadaceae bacterium]|nr:hypothetical protein [Xanthomonadaceae bacterium]
MTQSTPASTRSEYARSSLLSSTGATGPDVHAVGLESAQRRCPQPTPQQAGKRLSGVDRRRGWPPGLLASALALSLTLLVLTACGGGRSDVSIGLDGEHAIAAEKRLYPQFELAHGSFVDLPADVDLLLGQTLKRLTEAAASEVSYQLQVTAEAEPDAGCLAGGLIFISEGLLAWIASESELTAVTAMAMQQCGQSSAAWRKRDSSRLPEGDFESALMTRYRDFRLPENAALFNQLVASGCDAADCLQASGSTLEQAGIPTEVVLNLGLRIGKAAPRAVWLERSGLAAGLDGATVSSDDREPIQALARFHA